MSTINQIKKLGRQLYPSGRAFNMPKDGNFDKLNNALSESQQQAYDDANAILDAILPDNANFTADDATDWEVRLGMITNPLVSLDDRKAAIIRKMNHPGDIPARQSWDYLQESLQLAGFDVYVHENIPEQNIIDVLTLNPSVYQWGNGQFGNFQFGNVYSVFSNLLCPVQFGNVQFGGFRWGQIFYKQKVANHIDSLKDIYFHNGDNFRSIYYIGGATLGTFADVDINRKDEFRQLILKIKPVQSIGYLLINYI